MKKKVRDMLCSGMWALILVAWGSPILAGTLPEDQRMVHQGESDLQCHRDLSHLHDEMEVLLKSIYVKQFREAIRHSLKASILDAVKRIDGLKVEIASLRREIQHQIRVEKSAEHILRDITKTSEGPFKPCRRTEKGGYCETLERYYMAKAANLANRGFLDALICYQEKGLQ